MLRHPTLRSLALLPARRALMLIMAALLSTAFGHAAPLVTGASWLQGQGVDVMDNFCGGCGQGQNSTYGGVYVGIKWECVELAQRLYYAKGWYRNPYTGNGMFQGVDVAWRIYDLAPSLGMVRYPNGSSTLPVPGDMIVLYPNHVVVVDRVTPTTVEVVEQNVQGNGRATFVRSGNTLSRGGFQVRGWVHDPQNNFTNGGGSGGGSYPRYLFGAGPEGWSALWSSTPIAWTNQWGWPGVIYADQTGPDIEWQSANLNLAGGDNASVNVDVYPQFGNTASHDMQLFWRTANQNYFTSDKASAIVSYTKQNGFKRINLSANSLKWSGKTVTGLRLDFDQVNHGNRWLVNHVIVQTTPREYFDTGAAGWYGAYSLTPVAWTNLWGWPGIIYADQTGPDAYFVGPRISFIGAANDVVNVELYPQGGGTSHDARLYWTTDGQSEFDDTRSVLLNYTGTNQWVTLSFKVGANPSWQNITRLRLDVDTVNTGTRWIINYIKIDHGNSD